LRKNAPCGTLGVDEAGLAGNTPDDHGDTFANTRDAPGPKHGFVARKLSHALDATRAIAEALSGGERAGMPLGYRSFVLCAFAHRRETGGDNAGT
jgi:hypothetical protein